MFPTQMGRLDQAKSQFLQLSSRQMAKIFLEFPARWACVPSEIHDPQVAAQIAGHREREEGQRGPLQRRETDGKPHASFNSGMSTGREGRHSGYPTWVLAAHQMPL